MTATSFANYKDLLNAKLVQLANNIAEQKSAGNNSYIFLQHKASILLYYYDLINLYTLISSADAEEYYNYNFLSPDDMILLAEFAHKILNINYILDFILTTTDEFGEIPSYVFPDESSANCVTNHYNILY